MGADNGIFAKCEDILEPLSVAKEFCLVLLKKKPDLIIMGKQAIDDDMNATGQMLSALLGLWQLLLVKLKLMAKWQMLAEVDDGIEHLELKLPAIVTMT